MERMCSMCRNVKNEETHFRFMQKQNKFNSYCKACEKLYIKEYMRIYRERKRANGRRSNRLVNK